MNQNENRTACQSHLYAYVCYIMYFTPVTPAAAASI